MRIPIATYRIQFNSDFPFESAEAIIPYLKELGISDLYASPIFKARNGSTHGYDVVDPRHINPELGDRHAFESLVKTLHAQEMGWLQDIVPNHMAYDSSNEFLMDVMEHGPHSDYYTFFDIEWEHPYKDIESKVLAPMLGDFYGRCLENGELTLSYDETGLAVNYYDLHFPLRIESYIQLITYQLQRLEASLGRDDPDFIKLLGILYLVKSTTADSTGQQYRDQVTFVKGLLWELYQSNSEVQAFIDENLAIFNGHRPPISEPEPSGTGRTSTSQMGVGLSESEPLGTGSLGIGQSGKKEPEAPDFGLLDALLSEQFFRLSFWKVGAEELNYRRFFTVNELICVRIDDPTVFNITHQLIKELVDEGWVDGVRIDHIDGLYNPLRYLERLRAHLGDAYVIVEKILESGETLPEDWPVQGTTGYEFLNHVNGLFCQVNHEADFTRIYRQFTGQIETYEEQELTCKQLIVDKNLAGDVENLANLLKQIASRYRYASDFTLIGLRRAILTVLVLFPVYRTYVTEAGLNERNRTYIQRVIQEAKRRVPQYVNELDFIAQLFLQNYEDWITEEDKAQRTRFVMRMQQYSGPLMAKGVEDTLLYIYHRLLSLNEVGGSPDRFGVTLPEFHAFNQQQVTYWPHSMNTSSSHDTKRSEDVRARLNVLSEMPGEWEAEVFAWKQLNHAHKTVSGDRAIPDANDEYALYQTLIGAYPFEPYDHETFVQRIKDFAIKAVREAKVHTAWLRPDTEYEDGFLRFVDALLASQDDNPFLERLKTFQSKIAFYGMVNSLAQHLLKMTAPGVPDIYQGTEMWDLSLVDPDNRRPVDYEHRFHELQELRKWAEGDRPGLLQNLISYPEDGRIKLFLTAEILATLSQNSDIFQGGKYVPVRVTGTYDDHVVAFLRRAGSRYALTVVPRFPVMLCEPGQFPLGKALWKDTALDLTGVEPLTWSDVFSGRSHSGASSLPLGAVLSEFPVALLISS
ncbi:MAG: malto-oligosyltrehalose synthase [Leptolyngbyaceae bacterium]|nr:malto-oligosyltrehalose synthase [Leptolyngbyaceae bacterium]